MLAKVMGRIRSIKPEFFQHEELFDLEVRSALPLRVAFAGLWTQCDREGRFKWRPRTLKAAVLPFDDVDFSRVLDALSTGGFVVKYASAGEDYGYIPKWHNHQYVNGKEQPSKIPNPFENQDVGATDTRDSRDSDAITTDGVKEGKGKDWKGTSNVANPTEAAMGYCHTFDVVGEKNINLIRDAIKVQVEKYPKESPQSIAELFIERRREYMKLSGVTFEWTPVSFITSGTWRNPNAWLNGSAKDAKVGAHE